MHFAVRRCALWFPLACCFLLGCAAFIERPEGSPPALPVAAPDGDMTVEVFSAPAPLDDPDLASLWNKVDEQAIPPEVRARLARNGMRAGIVTAHVPDELAELLRVTDAPISAEERSLVPMETDPGVLLRVLQPQPGKRNELVVSPVHDEISLLRGSNGEVRGKTYRKAEGRLVLTAYPQSDGQVRLEVTPELHHGDPKTQTTGSEGMFIYTTQREKQVFSDLSMPATLGPGQMLLITCLNDHPNSVGHHLFVRQEADKTLQRLWVLRVAQAGPDGAFVDWTAEAIGEKPEVVATDASGQQ